MIRNSKSEKSTAELATPPAAQESARAKGATGPGRRGAPAKAGAPRSGGRGGRAAPEGAGTGRAATGKGAKAGGGARGARGGGNDRKQALEFTLQQIHKAHGTGAIMYLGANDIRRVDVIPTGALSIDHALGVGGIPRARVTEVFGPESSGKTTLTLHIIANAQRQGGVAAFIDAEHALDPTYARKLGVDLDSLLVSQPDSGEQALEIAEMLVSSSAVDVVVVDSVAALVPRAELEGQMGDSHVGLQARLMSQALRKLTGVIHRSNTSVVFINQIREKIGVMFGSPETTTGGRALKFYSSVRIDVRRIGSVKSGGDVSGNRCIAKIVKNKLAPPFRRAEFDIIFDRGICRLGDMLDLAVENQLVTKSGTWFSMDGERLGQGRERSVQFLTEHPELAKRLEEQLRQRLFETPEEPQPTEPQPTEPQPTESTE